MKREKAEFAVFLTSGNQKNEQLFFFGRYAPSCFWAKLGKKNRWSIQILPLFAASNDDEWRK